MNKHLLIGALGLSLACVLQPAVAEEEKVLRLFNWADYFAPDTLANFTRETGIRVIYDVMDSSETLEAKMMAGHSGYDLVFPGDTVAERLMRAGALQKLDDSKLTQLADIEPGLQTLQTQYPYSRHAVVPYTWGSIGLTYNQAKIEQRMPGAPVNSLDMLFKPEVAKRFADCGISMIDSPDEVLAVVLNYLGRDPRSGKPQDLADAWRCSTASARTSASSSRSRSPSWSMATCACRWATAATSPSRNGRPLMRRSPSASSTASRAKAPRCGWTPWPFPSTRRTRNTPMR